MNKNKETTSASTLVVVVAVVIGVFAYNFFSGSENTFKDDDTSYSVLLPFSTTNIVPAQKELNKLTVRNTNNTDGYIKKKYFGSTWKNANVYGFTTVPKTCNTRNAVLILQGLDVEYNTSCTISKGIWVSPYTMKTITDKSNIDIDHIVPLKDAWDSGADKWNNQKRYEYANSKQVLIISDSTSNSEKSDNSPDAWMPNKNKCGYLIKWIDIKDDWNLSVTKQEKTFIDKGLKACKEK
jgi:hypothetical protein